MAKLPAGWDVVENSGPLLPPDQQLREVMRLSGLGIENPPDIVFDGKPKRFKVEGDRRGETSGWYVAFGDKIPAGSFGNWRLGKELDQNWMADIGREISAAEMQVIQEGYALAKLAREEEQRIKHAEAAVRALEIWEGAALAPEDHPYLVRKQVQPHSLRMTDDGKLVMPIVIDGQLASVQYIGKDGQKRFLSGGEIKGGYYALASQDGSGGPLFIAEGFATGASVLEATGCDVAVALNANNLTPVALKLREQFPMRELIIVGDNDESGVGQKEAQRAAEATGGKAVIPPDVGDANDYAVAGKDLKALLMGVRGDPWLVPVSEFCAKPAPIQWLIRGHVQRDALQMVFGASGSGKTFLVLDWVLRIASGISTWAGNKVRHGSVVYLAGEGHHGLKARIAGWMAHHNVNRADLWVSQSGVDLDKDEVVHGVIRDIARTGMSPAVIVVDTLHRFLSGDENKAQDVRAMLASCALLQKTFGATVILVHHTGVNMEAQGRGRGSSSWKGALDLESRVTKGEGNSLQLEQTKVKDGASAPEMFFEMTDVDVPGWIDEDGFQVTTIVLNPTEEENLKPDKKEKPLTANQQLGLQTYREAALQHAKVDENGRFVGVQIEDWRSIFYSKSTQDTDQAKRQSFYRARSDLVKLRKMVVECDIYRLSGEFSELEITNISEKIKNNVRNKASF